MKITKVIWMTVRVLMIASLCGFAVIDGVHADEGRVYGGYCPTCGRDMPADHFPHEGGSSGGYDSGGWMPPVQTGPSPAELEMQRKRREASELNKKGIECWNKRDWKKAAEYFQKALKLNPTNETIKDNLRRANNEIANEKWLEDIRAKENQDMEDAKRRISNMLDNFNQDLDGSHKSSSQAAGETATGPIEFVGINEPLFSKGTKTSAPVDLSEAELSKPIMLNQDKTREIIVKSKGLIIKEVPKPDSLKSKWYDYWGQRPADITLDVLQKKDGNLKESIEYLQEYLMAKNPHDVNIKQSLSYLEGLYVGSAAEKDSSTKKKESHFAATPDDSRWLLEAVSGKQKLQWPGPKNPEVPLDNPLDWRVQRREMVFDALEQGNSDWGKAFAYLEEKANQKDQEKILEIYTASQALAYLEGFYAYKQFLDKKEADKEKGDQ